ncbi:1463_t:CDS:2, partial [Gigaspora margarita]
WYENGIEDENGMFERKSKHDENGKVFVNDKKNDSRLNQLEERKVECILMVSDSTNLNRGEMDSIMEVVDALLDVVMKTEKDSKDYSCEIGHDEVEAEMGYGKWIYTIIDYEKEIGDENPIDEIRIKYIIVNTNSDEMDQTNSGKFECLSKLSSKGTLNIKFANMNDIESKIRIEIDEHRVYWYCQKFDDESYGKGICDDKMTGDKNESKKRVDLGCSYQNDDLSASTTSNIPIQDTHEHMMSKFFDNHNTDTHSSSLDIELQLYDSLPLVPKYDLDHSEYKKDNPLLF